MQGSFRGFPDFTEKVCFSPYLPYNPRVLPISHFSLMSDVTLINAIQTGAQKDNQPRFETGMEVEVHQIIKDGDKERIQKFKGLIISMRGSSPLTRMITVRADMDGIGIEKIFPINSPFIAEIKILRKFKVRRNNIGYIRNLTGKAARLKEIK